MAHQEDETARPHALAADGPDGAVDRGHDEDPIASETKKFDEGVRSLVG